MHLQTKLNIIYSSYHTIFLERVSRETFFPTHPIYSYLFSAIVRACFKAEI